MIGKNLIHGDGQSRGKTPLRPRYPRRPLGDVIEVLGEVVCEVLRPRRRVVVVEREVVVRPLRSNHPLNGVWYVESAYNQIDNLARESFNKWYWNKPSAEQADSLYLLICDWFQIENSGGSGFQTSYQIANLTGISRYKVEEMLKAIYDSAAN